MAFNKWFWDVFPKRCTAAWWVFMAGFLFLNTFYQEPVYTWLTTQYVLLIFGWGAMFCLVYIGNYYPGVPNMPLPLLTGWALACGADPMLVLSSSIFVWLSATLGSAGIFARARRERSGLIMAWQLNQSESYRGALNAVRSFPNVIRRSRIGKFAALCGHVNIAAGVDGYDIESFYRQMILGHLLWTIQYVAIGFAIGWLLPHLGKLLF